jgi:hypothetical protein
MFDRDIDEEGYPIIYFTYDQLHRSAPKFLFKNNGLHKPAGRCPGRAAVRADRDLERLGVVNVVSGAPTCDPRHVLPKP